MAVFTSTLEKETAGFNDIIDITPEVAAIVKESGLRDGTVTVFVADGSGNVATCFCSRSSSASWRSAIKARSIASSRSRRAFCASTRTRVLSKSGTQITIASARGQSSGRAAMAWTRTQESILRTGNPSRSAHRLRPGGS